MASNDPFQALKSLINDYNIGDIRIKINGMDISSMYPEKDDDIEGTPKMDVFRVTFKDPLGEKTKIYTASMPIVREIDGNKFFWARDLIGDEYTFPVNCKMTVRQEFIEE